MRHHLFFATVLLLAGCDGAPPQRLSAAHETCANPQTDPAQALIACTKVIDDPRSSADEQEVSHYNRSVARTAMADWDGALADMNRVLALKPDSTRNLIARGIIHGNRGDMEFARQDFESAIRLDPNEAAAHANLGTTYEREDRAEEALPHLDRALALQPDAPNALGARCWVLTRLNRDLPRALADCNRALTINDQDYNSYNSRGFLHYRLGHYTESIADYDRAIGGDPKSASSFYMRGMARRALGHAAGAYADIAQGLQMLPGVAERYARFGIPAP